jgi:hypothetical protein
VTDCGSRVEPTKETAVLYLADSHPVGAIIWVLSIAGLGVLALVVAIITMNRKKRRPQGRRR